MRNLIWLASIGIAAPLAYAEEQQSNYEYGDRPDIAKVLSLDVPSDGCNVVEATMTYLDSNGETHAMRYLRQGADCHDN
ncbi:DUF2790 domain-containing protein [Stutzerimonas stutzeri]|jgi:hypothetical protein|uniref:DUF2790 domain-containing protein n=1 Tax=Stutzerimonas stutzeri TaxID=316 RepID=UPI002658C0AE|nr:DUF2790 domain-containing protein [Stutzerimonas stutzeri]MCF6781013.1 DUF2790 domain-containing protein [Stutzerimonas stutzeri]MCF6803581.1 DUF2790 domain-containing protein [Stutzerimonas stutzeri]